MRISRDDMLMEMARVVAKRGTCDRLHVGAVISIEGRVLSTGYAGAPSGMPHCSPEVCDTSKPCTRTMHAEANAIAWAARKGVRLEGAELHCTHSPCHAVCSKLIINAGITRVVYENAYRLTEGIDLLRSVGITVDQWQAETRAEHELRAVPQLGVGGEPVPVGEGPEGCTGGDHCGVPRRP